MAVDEVDGIPWTRKHDDPRTPFLPQVPQIRYPTTLGQLIEFCRDRPPQTRLKAAGSHWALSTAAVSDHTFIETNDPDNHYQALSRTLTEVVPNSMDRELLDRMATYYDVELGSLVHVEAGKRIYQAYAELDTVDDLRNPTTLGGFLKATYDTDSYAGPWGFATLGGAGGQTVVGALTTGTHGGDFDRAPIADSVMALHLVVDGGAHYWIEPTRGSFWPQLTDDQKLEGLYGNLGADFTIIRDDTVFNAVLVSAGRFGIIYSVVLQVWKQYALRERRQLTTWLRVKDGSKTSTGRCTTVRPTPRPTAGSCRSPCA